MVLQRFICINDLQMYIFDVYHEIFIYYLFISGNLNLKTI